MRVAVVIPAFNEAATVAGIAEEALQYTQMVIVVDDGSDDDTATQLLEPVSYTHLTLPTKRIV